MPGETVLVIEDEQDIADLISFNLEREGYKVERASTGEDGLTRAKIILPQLVLLDLMLPGLNGLDVCRSLQSEPSTRNIPIIMLTARNEDADIVTGLEMGASDYITKPFSPRVLIARVRAVLRRTNGEEAEAVSEQKIGELVINREKRRILVAGSAVDLTQTEFDLLSHLARRPGWVLSRGQLIDALRDGRHVVTDRAIDVQVANLRKKLGGCGDYIETVRGVGYRMKESV